jgi:hypothetical protein
MDNSPANEPLSPDEFSFEERLFDTLSERQRKRAINPNITPIFNRKQIEQAFLESFELIGGVPRLAMWANDARNYGLFLSLLTKFVPKAEVQAFVAPVLEYRSNVPQSPLNRVPDTTFLIDQPPEEE